MGRRWQSILPLCLARRHQHPHHLDRIAQLPPWFGVFTAVHIDIHRSGGTAWTWAGSEERGLVDMMWFLAAGAVAVCMWTMSSLREAKEGVAPLTYMDV